MIKVYPFTASWVYDSGAVNAQSLTELFECLLGLTSLRARKRLCESQHRSQLSIMVKFLRVVFQPLHEHSSQLVVGSSPRLTEQWINFSYGSNGLLELVHSLDVPETEPRASQLIELVWVWAIARS